MATPKMLHNMRVSRFSYDVEMGMLSLVTKLIEDHDALTAVGWSNLHFDLGEEDQYSDYRSVLLLGSRMETIEEAERRERVERERLAEREKRDRAEYERLNALFGQSS